MTETLAHGYSSVSTLSKSYLINTNMTGFKRFSDIYLHLCALDRSSLDIGRVKRKKRTEKRLTIDGCEYEFRKRNGAFKRINNSEDNFQG